VVRAGARHRSGHLIGAIPLILQRAWLICHRRRHVGAQRPAAHGAATHDAERDGAEQRALRATRRELDTDTREVLHDASADLDQALADGRKLRERVCLRNEGTPCISQNAAVWKASRTAAPL
jgi:hypothetical protein